MVDVSYPPGAPGILPRWTSSAKSGVGTALNPSSRVWFTVSHGILNEIYAPRLDTACTRDFGLVVTGKDYFSEEKRDTDHRIEAVLHGVPAFRLTNIARDGRYRITKTIFSDPLREVVLQDIHFEALIGKQSDYQVHAIIAPHLVNAGSNNTAWVGDFKGRPMLFAEGRGASLAVASSSGFLTRSAGYVGVSDGWQTLSRGDGVRPEFVRAENGNVALTGTLNLPSGNGRVVLAIGFGVLPEEAALRTLLSLQEPLPEKLEEYCSEWKTWQNTLLTLDEATDRENLNRYRVSTCVLATHRDVSSGAIIAGLSVPWGFSKGDDDLGGYHLVWPRDLVETAGGLLAAGDIKAAKDVLQYLAAIQEADGHWSQNSWLDGRPYWGGVQMDETGFPVLLYDMLFRAGAVSASETSQYVPMIRAAAGYIVRNGPVTPQDRWEEDPGYTPFTLAVEIAALVVAADAMRLAGENSIATYLLETADHWNEQIETWTYATDTELARQLGISGYYLRIGSAIRDDLPMSRRRVVVRNRLSPDNDMEASKLLSPDALALVRFGLRAADDVRITNTVKAIDALLRRDLPNGTYWYRYNDDGYGEHADGSPFDGTGIGRLWPLLTGERAHYELTAGRPLEAKRLLASLEAAAGPGGLLPEQIWDSEEIEERELTLGRPSGSAMPLVWAHAEHIKLLRSLRDGALFDLPPQTYRRYVASKPLPAPFIWRLADGNTQIAAGRKLRIELNEPAVLHWSSDNWKSASDLAAKATGLGTYICDLATSGLDSGNPVVFTFYWSAQNRWLGFDFRIDLDKSAGENLSGGAVT